MNASGNAVDPDAVVLLHGFAQTSRCWRPLVDRLGHRRTIVALDLAGHGPEPAAPRSLADDADRVCELGGPGTYLGYSLGGRVALHAALRHPEAVRRLVLVSATAGIEDERDRAARRASDDALATRIEEHGVDAFVDEWLRNPLFAGLSADAQFVAERRVNTAAGLAGSLRMAGTGSQDPLWDRLSELAMPVLVLAGADDPKFADFAERMASLIGANATLVIVGDAGHSVHLEQPDAVADVLDAWLGVHRATPTLPRS